MTKLLFSLKSFAKQRGMSEAEEFLSLLEDEEDLELTNSFEEGNKLPPSKPFYTYSVS